MESENKRIMNVKSLEQYKDNLLLIRNYQNWIKDLNSKRKNGSKKEKNNLRLQVLLSLSLNRAKRELTSIRKYSRRMNRRQTLPIKKVNYIVKIIKNCIRTFKNFCTNFTRI